MRTYPWIFGVYILVGLVAVAELLGQTIWRASHCTLKQP
jgi:hypothetical protein